MTRKVDTFHIALFALSMAILVAAVVLTGTGTPFALDILLVSAAPWVLVVGFETVGHRHAAEQLAALR